MFSFANNINEVSWKVAKVEPLVSHALEDELMPIRGPCGYLQENEVFCAFNCCCMANVAALLYYATLTATLPTVMLILLIIPIS
eukprot:XP_001708627.1 Hypothetical protein GL50803_106137 [Giardia lamblia ATCC 50803]